MTSEMLGSVIFDRYRIERNLGSGATGSVYLCTDLKLGTSLAIKVLSKHKDTEKISRIEENTLKLLNHRSLPQIIDILSDNDFTYIVESYIEGTPLDRLSKEYHKFSEKQVIEWSIQICDALSYLHILKPNPIIYRDIKPSNIIITIDNKAVLVDFGSCIKYLGKHSPDDIIMGTSLYSAPEQLIIGGVSDYRTDIYCLGSTMYQLITGELPSSNMKERLGESKYLSNGIKAIIIKCIEKEKTKRYNDMEELKDYLNAQYKYTISIMVNDENKIKIIPVIIIVLSLITYLTVIIGLNI